RRQPELMIYLTGACEVGHWNVVTNARTALITISGYGNCALGPWEGNTSNDGRWAAVDARRSSDGAHVAFVVDLTTRQKYPDLELGAHGVTNVDWVSVSAT